MSKLGLAASALALAVLGGPGASLAQITPAPNTFTLAGPLSFTRPGAPPFTCNATMSVTFNAIGMTGSVTSFNLTAGSPFCAALAPVGLPWTAARITLGTLPRIAVSNIKLVAVLSYCDNGTINISWVNAPHNTGYVVTQGVMPGNFSGLPYPNGHCTLEGELHLTSAGPLDIQ